jgi:cytochrome-b5 reductase
MFDYNNFFNSCSLGFLGWKYSSGFVSAEMIATHLYPPADDTFVVMCGPPPMINFACIPNMDKLGYSAKLRFAY